VVADFDTVLFNHAGSVCQNGARALVHALTGSYLAGVLLDTPARRYYQLLERCSAAFALVADVSMLIMHSALKRREMLSARLGDLLSMMYLASMVLKEYEDEGCPAEDLPLVDWACQYLLHAYQQAMQGILRNFPLRSVAWLLQSLVLPLGGRFNAPSDRLELRIAELVTRDTATRRRMLAGIYLTVAANNPLGRLNEVFLQALALEPLEQKLHAAVKSGRIAAGLRGAQFIAAAETAGVVTVAEARQLRQYEAEMLEVIAVDDFSSAELARTVPPASTPAGAGQPLPG
jgi:acyl-CoA dehydrogenase